MDLPEVQIILGESARQALTWPSKAAYIGGPLFCYRPIIMDGLFMADSKCLQTSQMHHNSPVIEERAVV